MGGIDVTGFNKRRKFLLAAGVAALVLFVPVMLVLFKTFRVFNIDSDFLEIAVESAYVLAWAYFVSRFWLIKCPKCGRAYFMSNAMKRTKTEGFFDLDFWKKCGYCGLVTVDGEKAGTSK